MKPPVETVRLSQSERGYLIKLKRYTGLKNWNVLCRWGFCLSLKEPSLPPELEIKSDSSVEMTWRTFGGEYADVYAALLMQRCLRDAIDVDNGPLVAHTFRLHLHRGLSYLAGDRELRGIDALIEKAVAA